VAVAHQRHQLRRRGGADARDEFAAAWPPARPPGSLDRAAAASSSWLDLQDDYWDKQGRKSVDAVALFGGLLTMGVAGRGALQELGLLPRLPSPAG
jgi:hypothetical protein